MIRIVSTVFGLMLSVLAFAQNFEIKQDDDDVIFFNQSENSIEVWLRMQNIAFNELVKPGEMKKVINPNYLTEEDLINSEVVQAYSYRALLSDVKLSMQGFYDQLEKNRRLLNRGSRPINKAFYELESFNVFLNNPDQVGLRTNLNSEEEMMEFIEIAVIPPPKNLMDGFHQNSGKSRAALIALMHEFVSTEVRHEGEESIFIEKMQVLSSFFNRYNDLNNQTIAMGNLEDNDFKLFTGTPGFNFGVYIVTNNFGNIERYDFPNMDTRGFNFEVAASYRFMENRLSKRRTLNYHASATYLNLVDDGFDFKKSFMTLGPQIRYTGYYENQVELIGETGVIFDITANKNMAENDKRQFGYYFGGEISLLFVRLGVRYYDRLTEPELSPEGKLFYRLGLVLKL